MHINKIPKTIQALAAAFSKDPRTFFNTLRNVPAVTRGFAFARDGRWEGSGSKSSGGRTIPAATENPLRKFFEARQTGRGIWKCEHYFDIYQRHFSRFVGREVGVLEIGVYSGGSLDMWRSYFGAACTVYGVDIESACQAYAGPGVNISIGDQADRSFWKGFKQQVPAVDIVIDDGGHLPEQQIVTLEEMLPHLRPGGIYWCEDVTGIHHEFAAYVSGLASHLHQWIAKPGKVLAAESSGFQRAVYSIHQYPFVVVIEKTETPVTGFLAPKHGTQWQPYL